MSARKSWLAECRYDGLEPFYFGTVFADGVEHAHDLLIQAWQTVFPHPLPPVFNVMAGHIVVTLEDA